MRNVTRTRVGRLLILSALTFVASTVRAADPVAPVVAKDKTKDTMPKEITKAKTDPETEHRQAAKEAPKTPRELALEAMRREFAGFGMLALLDAKRHASQPSPWSDPPPTNPTITIEDGSEGLQLSTSGEWGGSGQGVSVQIATLGRGEGVKDVNAFDHGRAHLLQAYIEHPPEIRITPNAHLPAEAIQRIVRQSFGNFRSCYQSGLRKNPRLQGRIAVKFTIDHNGAVSLASDGGSDLEDTDVVSCVVRGFAKLAFPDSIDPVITVVYPLTFAPGQ